MEKETVKKLEYIFDNTIINEKVKNIFNQYINILNINYEEGRYIITHNVWATTWFWLVTTNWGIVCTNKIYVEKLIKGTLGRTWMHRDYFTNEYHCKKNRIK